MAGAVTSDSVRSVRDFGGFTNGMRGHGRDGSYYVGSTTNLEVRLKQHNNDPDGPVYTRRRRPVRVVVRVQYSV